MSTLSRNELLEEVLGQSGAEAMLMMGVVTAFTIDELVAWSCAGEKEHGNDRQG